MDLAIWKRQLAWKFSETEAAGTLVRTQHITTLVSIALEMDHLCVLGTGVLISIAGDPKLPKLNVDTISTCLACTEQSYKGARFLLASLHVSTR